jgi:hypothetical protein
MKRRTTIRRVDAHHAELVVAADRELGALHQRRVPHRQELQRHCAIHAVPASAADHTTPQHRGRVARPSESILRRVFTFAGSIWPRDGHHRGLFLRRRHLHLALAPSSGTPTRSRRPSGALYETLHRYTTVNQRLFTTLRKPIVKPSQLAHPSLGGIDLSSSRRRQRQH